jgi:MoaA/NifB/PqqE/SkfB family radical SAM enzyme
MLHKTHIKKVHWNVQTACNMPCGFCYLWRKPQTFRLSTKTAKDLLQQTIDCNVEWFVFGGGDPLLRQDFLELLEFAHSLGLKVDLQTNAILLNQINVEAVFTRINRLGLSLDGEDEITHDTIRNYSGHFKIILNTLSLCEQYSIPTTIRTVVCRQNLGKLSKLAMILNDYSCIEKWSLRQFAPLGRGKLLQDRYEISDAEFTKEVQQVIQTNKILPLKFPVVSVAVSEMTNCYCLIAEDGQVYGHPSDGVYRSVGTFPQQPLAKLLSKLNVDGLQREMRDLKVKLK